MQTGSDEPVANEEPSSRWSTTGWRRWISVGRHWNTAEEKRAAGSTLDLFFGALLGANLARSADVSTVRYAFTVGIGALAFVVLAATRKSISRFRTLGIWILLLACTGAAVAASFIPTLNSVADWVKGPLIATVVWLIIGWWIDSPAGPDTADAIPTGHDSPSAVELPGPPLLSIALTGLTILAITVAGYLKLATVSEHPFAYLIYGAGIFELVLGGAALAIAIGGVALANRAAETLPETASATQRDHRTIKQYGGTLMSATGGGVGLVLLQGAQSSTAVQGSSTVGFFDLMTWLGTFGTLVVVVCGALVAVYAKRREDEARQLDSVRNMRQAWINEVRDLLASLMLNARILADAATHRVVSTDVVRLALADLRRLELHLNPTEPHHVVLIEALRSLLHHSSLQGHLGQSAIIPLASTEWSQLHD
ncbi:hypothetical protein [Sphingomonas sp. CFBP 8765]|uniref:hypothetical protein n=1 Tax=Sphingomonas sp. CFBP 8765 TaxID=2775274 RepID=UPI001785E71B|nr:hypothetical protein [Sphingomonas sp. CFBP 8765]MBD8472175.1 hypothetical protein [Sphingomonas sp. CFBP 8765]